MTFGAQRPRCSARALGGLVVLVDAIRAQAPTGDPSEPEEDASGLSIGAIVVTGVGALLLIGFLVFMVKMNGCSQCRFTARQTKKPANGAANKDTRKDQMLLGKADKDVELGPQMSDVPKTEVFVPLDVLSQQDTVTMSSSAPKGSLGPASGLSGASGATPKANSPRTPVLPNATQTPLLPPKRNKKIDMFGESTGPSAMEAIEKAKAAHAAGETKEEGDDTVGGAREPTPQPRPEAEAREATPPPQFVVSPVPALLPPVGRKKKSVDVFGLSDSERRPSAMDAIGKAKAALAAGEAKEEEAGGAGEATPPAALTKRGSRAPPLPLAAEAAEPVDKSPPTGELDAKKSSKKMPGLTIDIPSTPGAAKPQGAGQGDVDQQMKAKDEEIERLQAALELKEKDAEIKRLRAALNVTDGAAAEDPIASKSNKWLSAEGAGGKRGSAGSPLTPSKRKWHGLEKDKKDAEEKGTRVEWHGSSTGEEPLERKKSRTPRKRAQWGDASGGSDLAAAERTPPEEMLGVAPASRKKSKAALRKWNSLQ
eukprot:TRINITY_DN1079_c0_g1_i1.p1 TRINITY_DN1079_c0_g1~~TRINITY_DN1079_c0_g1_i1.p1  ORF type:complete len:538 (+),score=149.87 TRINITY_DN1079_c0_g1_i1:42-1655(+)